MEERYIVGLGEALWDVLPEGKKLGGATTNFAYHASQIMGCDNAMAISALGNDDLADETEKSLVEHNLRFIMPRVTYQTGTVHVTLSGDGIPTYEIKENVAWDNIPMTDDIEQVARHCRAVCFGSLAQRSAKSRTFIRHFIELTPDDCLKIFDINLRQNYYSLEVIEESIRRCNILKINDEELVEISRLFELTATGDEAKCRFVMEKYGLEILILTCGTEGSYVFTADETLFRPTPKVEVADTVGAGDSFTAAFVASILDGEAVAEAHRKAVATSAYVCTQSGAMPTHPQRF